MEHLHHTGRFGAVSCPNAERLLSTSEAMVPRSRCATAAAPRAEPPSRSRGHRPQARPGSSAAASAPEAVQGPRRCAALAAAQSSSTRQSASLQCVAPSTSDHSAPAAFASLRLRTEQPRADPEQHATAKAHPSHLRSPHGNGSSSGSHASSSFDSSCPLISARHQLVAQPPAAAARPAPHALRRVPRAARATRPGGSRRAPARVVVATTSRHRDVQVPERVECRPDARTARRQRREPVGIEPRAQR